MKTKTIFFPTICLLAIILIASVTNNTKISQAEDVFNLHFQLINDNQFDDAFDLILSKPEYQVMVDALKYDYTNNSENVDVSVLDSQQINDNLFEFKFDISKNQIYLGEFSYFVILDGDFSKLLINQRDIPDMYLENFVYNEEDSYFDDTNTETLILEKPIIT